MRIGLISARRISTFAALEERALERGHEVHLLKFNEITLTTEGLEAVVAKCAEYDVVHYYAGFGAAVGEFVGQILKDRGIPVVNNSADLYAHGQDKIYQALIFDRVGLPAPKGLRSFYPDFDALSEQLGVPFLAKKPHGTQGGQVHLIDNLEAFSALSLPGEYLYQEFVPHKNDFRVHVIGGEQVFCLYRRVPLAGNFKANVSLGATMEPVIDADERKVITELALRAARELKYDLCGVDIFRSESDGQYRIIEVNRNPGWKHVNDVTGECFEDFLIDYYESIARA